MPSLLTKYVEIEKISARKTRQIIHPKPIAFEQNGNLLRINSNWADSGSPAFPHVITYQPFFNFVSPAGERRFHPTRELDRFFIWGAPKIKMDGEWTAPDLGDPTRRKDNLIEWRRAQANYYIWSAGHYSKMGILLKDGWIPPDGQIAFEVQTQGLNRSGRVFLADGVPVMRLRLPVVYDYDNEEDTRQITYAIERIDGKWHVIMTLPDLAGMSRPMVDPTLELQPDATDGMDTYIASGANADKNYGVRTENNSKSGVKGLIKFDLSTIPAGSTITSAVLTLYTTNPSPGTVNMHRSLVQWYEGDANGAAPSIDGSTWNYRNHIGSIAWAGGAGGATGSDYAADATATGTPSVDETSEDFSDASADVQGFVDGSYSNYGWWLLNDSSTVFIYATSDHATEANRPKLTVVYEEAGSNPIWFFHDRNHRSVHFQV